MVDHAGARGGQNKITQLSPAEFNRGWYSIGFLYPGLHPDSTLEHGTETSNVTEDFPEISKIEPRLLAPFFVNSGWPVVLAPVAEEAWRRYKTGDLKDEEFYCSEAVVAGMCCRSPGVAVEVQRERNKLLLMS
jgi:DNA (cytosine-5)-methyltransferase 1